MDHIVVDVEIQKTIEETPGGWDSTHLLGVACAVVYEYQDDRFRIFGPDDLPALRDRLLRADRITGYNIWKFDLPVIFGLPGRERVTALAPKTDDLLMRIWSALGLNPHTFSDAHKGWSLDAVALGTLRVGKIGNGADAPRWYQAGQLHRVINYCADDVALERDLGRFMDTYGYVVHGRHGHHLPVPAWRPGAIE